MTRDGGRPLVHTGAIRALSKRVELNVLHSDEGVTVGAGRSAQGSRHCGGHERPSIVL